MSYKTITKQIAPDFRTINPSRSVVLPKSAKLIPIAFWALLFGILLYALVIGRIGVARNAKALVLDSDATKVSQEITVFQKRKEVLKSRVEKAERLYDWVTSVPMVQPLLVTYFSSFSDDDNVSRIHLVHSDEFPGQYSCKTVYQGEAPLITILYQKNITELAKSGWSLAQSERKIQGNTVSIESFVRVDNASPWSIYGLTEEEFQSALKAELKGADQLNSDIQIIDPLSPEELRSLGLIIPDESEG